MQEVGFAVVRYHRHKFVTKTLCLVSDVINNIAKKLRQIYIFDAFFLFVRISKVLSAVLLLKMCELPL